MNKKAVGVVMAAVTALIIGWDIYLALDGVPSNTISARLRAWHNEYGGVGFLVTFAMGLLVGHWWWQPRGSK